MDQIYRNKERQKSEYNNYLRRTKQNVEENRRGRQDSIWSYKNEQYQIDNSRDSSRDKSDKSRQNSESPNRRERSNSQTRNGSEKNNRNFKRGNLLDRGRSSSKEEDSKYRIYDSRERSPYRARSADNRSTGRTYIPKVSTPKFTGIGEDLPNFINNFFRYAKLYNKEGEDAANLIPFFLEDKALN